MCDETQFGDYLNGGVYFNKDQKGNPIFENGQTKCFCEPSISDSTYACADEDEDCYFNEKTS
jgi:hypothetical protein